jgi:nitrate reductase NapAB chaperone NapD
MADCIADLESLPGVEVHFSYPESGRIILVQETETIEAQGEGFRRIQALPRVRMAALVEHRVDPDSGPLNL